MDTEIWGLCGWCDRWFYCPGWYDKGAPQPLCPVCGSEPAAIDERPTGRTTIAAPPREPLSCADAPAHRLITGLCPKCGSWFACNDWFDSSVPLPCCPSCHLPPVKIHCQTPSGTLKISVDLDRSLGGRDDPPANSRTPATR
ncbi:MAG TPA: hypothetical protein VM324_00735 [Egibacteraceae bacterium]|jgi:hypothetical protein|nr:hypothetical protein [Egibacteraceae bacterium]